MTFDELLNAACESAGLPSMAREFLPDSLSKGTKALAMKLRPEEFGVILKNAIDKIEKGSVESLNTLIEKELEGK